MVRHAGRRPDTSASITAHSASGCTVIRTFPTPLRAEAEAEVMFTETLADVARGTGGMQRGWRASVEWLKRRRRADYGDTMDIRRIDTEQLLEILRRQQQEAIP